jgi:hypothetical protein
MNSCSIFTLELFKGGLGIWIGREDSGRTRTDARSARRKAFDLADGHATLGNTASEAEASLRIVDCEERSRVAGGEATFLEEFLNRRFEFQEADGVRDGGSILSGAFGYLFLGELEFVDKALEGMGLLDWVQILALKIFDQRHFKCQVLRNVAKDNRNTVHIGTLGGTPATFAGDELVAIRDFADDERLNDSTGLD